MSRPRLYKLQCNALKYMASLTRRFPTRGFYVAPHGFHWAVFTAGPDGRPAICQ